MSWTAPKTWTAGPLTSSDMNVHVRDNLKAIGDAWTSYGSGASWTATGSNPSLGNGTWDGRYIQAGKLVVCSIVLTAGSTTTYGTGTYHLALPVTPLRTASRATYSGSFYDSDATNTYPIVGMLTGGLLSLRTWPTTAGNQFRNVTPSVPETMANGDQITITEFVYEAA